MDLEITPEPTPEERDAIACALAELAATRRPSPGEWWRQGLIEAVEDEEPESWPPPGS
jgi:hypothetical protein